ncbi:MAG: hypothetical protein JF597_07165 [Streptomyces sp.]|uniref:hypothetical protein n=1 Tax=Streptomyces sp. TaxID=1931 RepID=UPI0025E7BBFF|nr:hypothetical protein [Streptomyces sp.]MBW8793369.1 hypothetical protein [Streptomyces sp.]
MPRRWPTALDDFFGLLCADGSPKPPLETIRRIVTGTAAAPEEKPESPALADAEQ